MRCSNVSRIAGDGRGLLAPHGAASETTSSACWRDRTHHRHATDLNDGLPAIDGVDLAWASSSLHHLENPAALIGQVGQALPPGGWFVVVETDDVPWVLPQDLGIGRPGMEARCHDLLARRRSEHTPHLGADWRAHLVRAGLAVRAARVFDVKESAPPGPAGRYAHSLFAILRSGATGQLDAEDLATLDVLLDETDPRSLTQREDLVLTTTRRAWLAQRPDPRTPPRRNRT